MTYARLNLATANRVFIVEPQWNPSVENQAVARALRLGQKQAVLVTRYVVEQTVEQVSIANYRIDRLSLTPAGHARIAGHQTGKSQSHSKWLSDVCHARRHGRFRASCTTLAQLPGPVP